MEYNIDFTTNELHDEFFWLIETPGKCTLKTRHNKIIKYFQQDILYKAEKQLLNDPQILEKIINNRCKYLKKEPCELTTYDLIDGLKKSGIYYGYSMFNPLLAKWFFKQYGCTICYDPCGGWGHRILGATELESYIYNDISMETTENIKRMCEYFDIYNVKTYNTDSIGFIPDEPYDSIFTCPPYYNIEIYDKKIDYESYVLLIDSIINAYLNKVNCKVCGIVIREDLLPPKYLKMISEEIPLNNSRCHLCGGGKHKYGEKLYIFKK